MNFKDKIIGPSNEAAPDKMHTSPLVGPRLQGFISEMSIIQDRARWERDKDQAYRLFLALPEAFSRHGLKGRLVVQVMPRETRFHMSGDWTPNKEQRALIPWLSGQRQMSSFTWNPFNGSRIVFTLSLTLSEDNLSSRNKGKPCLSKMASATSEADKHSFSLSAMVFCHNSVSTRRLQAKNTRFPA